jgi:hypothetical protein
MEGHFLKTEGEIKSTASGLHLILFYNKKDPESNLLDLELPLRKEKLLSSSTANMRPFLRNRGC